MRAGSGSLAGSDRARAPLVLALLHHHLQGSPFDYLGVAAAAAVSWVGLPGPGESVLIATAVLSARRHLDITTVVLVAWIAATAGGIVGWLIGLKAGRAVLVAQSPAGRRGHRRCARG